jgi:predicted nucleic acid-binding Zn ribbon protein
VKLEISERNIHIEILGLAKCPECGTEFTPSRKDQVYCSNSCGSVVRVREFRKRKKELAENKI